MMWLKANRADAQINRVAVMKQDREHAEKKIRDAYVNERQQTLHRIT